VVVNIDIARLLNLDESNLKGLKKLNEMELAFLDLIDFNLFVSTTDYNKN